MTLANSYGYDKPIVTELRCFGLAIGFAFLGSGYACGHISGAALNPAVALPLGLGGGKDGRRRGAEGGKGWKVGDERVVFLGKMVENGGFTKKNDETWWFSREKWWNMVVLPWFTEKSHGI